ncbi:MULTISPECIES: fumarylacetoacetate hydrolase family protein [unclassified Aeromicrobium]|uniref:fumarylacetoacetate hydrolase family protein n=1 Tax=unclassified Aeromicrobium TaxID=2633570 RepID=UPI00396B263F
MKLLTFRREDGTTAAGIRHGDGTPDDVVREARIDGHVCADVGDVLQHADWLERIQPADGTDRRYGDLSLTTLVPRPGKVVCVGLNYRTHILEMGRELPQHPTLFAKFASTLTGPNDDIEAPSEDPALDWEAELTVVIGRQCRRVSETDAPHAIAGYTVANDISMRTWQFRTKEWLQGKAWDASTPVGPVLLTADEWDPASRIWTSVNGKQMQSATTDDLLFGPAELVSYVSTMMSLEPGDLILTGTPGGVGRAREPEVYLAPGDVVETGIDGIGTLHNRIVAAGAA